MRPIGGNVYWAFPPKKIGPTIRTDEFFAEEVLLRYLFSQMRHKKGS
jgi:hypothetical protein